MNENKNKIDLAKIVSKKTGLDEAIAEKFVDQFFFELNESIINNPSTRVDGIGLFRIIKSGNNNKVLFLGEKNNDRKLLNTELFKAKFSSSDNLDTKEFLTNENKSILNQNKVLSNIDNVNYKRHTEEANNSYTILDESSHTKESSGIINSREFLTLMTKYLNPQS